MLFCVMVFVLVGEITDVENNFGIVISKFVNLHAYVLNFLNGR